MAEQFSIPTEGDIVAEKYKILEELGRGSYGVVFRAEQLGISRFVALKTLLPKAFLQADIVQRFQREATLISRLQHPNIVTLFDFGQSDGVLYMAIELLHGQPLSDLIAAGPVPPERALHIITQVLAALEAAHREGIVHRDLKPENIILTQVGEREDVVKVLDFGIAKLTAGDAQEDALKTLTVQGYVLGTPHYMSPENITGDPVDHRADLYAVGIMLYELLAGVHPFDAPSPSAVLVKHLNDPPPPLPDVALERSNVGRAIRLALAKDPDDRIGSASDLIDLLEGRLELPPETLPPVVPAATGPSPLRPVLFVAAAILLVLFGVALTLALGSGEERLVVALDAGAVDGGTAEVSSVAVDAAAAPEPDAPEPDAPEPDAEEADAAAADAAEVAPPEERAASAPPASVAPASVAPPSSVAAPRSSPDPAHPEVGSHLLTTRLHFVSDPAEAQVVVNGAPVGVTPCSRLVRRDGGPVEVNISKIGYKTAHLTVQPTEALQKVTVKLQRGRLKLEP